MSNLKDTDIDDLFRRASDKYPLRTDSADWEKMAAALEKDPTPAGFDGADADDKRRKRRFFWLLLFLPLGGAGYYTWVHTGHGSSHPSTAVVAVQSGRSGGEGQVKTEGDGQGNASQKAGKGIPTAANGVPAGVTDARLKNGGGGQVKLDADASLKTDAGGQRITVAKGRVKRSGSGQGLTGADRQVKGDADRQVADAEKQVSDADGNRYVASNRPVRANTETATSGLQWAADMQRARIANDYHLSVAVVAPPAARKADPAKQKKPKTSYLYAGIIGAPDLSTVKMQSVKGVGATVGILLGYAFNERWSVETGAYLEKKKYYTEGEYFNKKALDLYANQQLLNVDGTCNMWEIPLSVRYTFNPAAKTKWFATAGLSTYLMSKENYSYAYERLSNGWIGHGALSNTTPSQYPFSIVNLSGGFEQSLGRVGNLRVEPYLRLPLGGIGTGKLPIMSAGVNIGITRRLW